MDAHAVLIVGSMALDELELPTPAPDGNGGSPTRHHVVVGGSATYASLCASAYAPVRVVAVVGRDFPEEPLDRMRARGIDTAGIERGAGLTFRWKGRYHEGLGARDTIETQLNVFASFRPRLPGAYADSPVVLLGNIHPALQLEVVAQIRAPQLVVADTMNLWIESEPEALAELLRHIDLLIINDEEVRLLSGLHNVARAARDILARGPRRLIVKRGEHGSLCFDREGVFAAPALPLEQVVDPTGAGDSYAGGLCGYLARERRYDHGAIRRAMLHGTATGSFCVEAVGISGIADLAPDPLRQRVERVRALMRVQEE